MWCKTRKQQTVTNTWSSKLSSIYNICCYSVRSFSNIYTGINHCYNCMKMCVLFCHKITWPRHEFPVRIGSRTCLISTWNMAQCLTDNHLRRQLYVTILHRLTVCMKHVDIHFLANGYCYLSFICAQFYVLSFAFICKLFSYKYIVSKIQWNFNDNCNGNDI